jgi:DNA-binding response OmpR family regulator
VNNKRSLIVDDEPDVAFAFKLGLEYNGFTERVDVYYDPLLALQNIKPDVCGLSIIIVVMPNMHGFALYTKIKKIDNKTKVFFVTAFEENYDVLKEFLLSFKVADINDEELAAVLVVAGGSFTRKPIDIDAWRKE